MYLRKSHRRADAQPTWTSRVLEFLTTADDFATVAQIMAGTGANINQATATLHHLKKFHAVDCLEADGQLWWFATPGDDTRERTVDMRVPEEPDPPQQEGGEVKQGPSGAPFRGWTDPETGRKTADAPAGWPFGTRAPAETADQDRAWARVQRESVRQLGADRRERVRETPDALM